MKILQTSNRTFNNQVKKIIATNIEKVVSYKKYNVKCVALKNIYGNTIAIWNQTKNGSEVCLLSEYE
tara:strand:- start:428 stop:628 length:201 start_codon:yes stop_codon:yes gene_type:complete